MPYPPINPKNPSKKSFNRSRKARNRYNNKKIDDMLSIIKNNITSEMKNGFYNISLKYFDVRLDFFIDFDDKDNKHIYIDAFSRSHYVRLHPEHRITHAPAKESNPASSKGDGGLFLALTVLHCNKVLDDVPYWIADVSDWWRIKGVCSIEKACTKTERSRHALEIDNQFFIDWSRKILDNYTSNEIFGGNSNNRTNNKKTHKKIKKDI